MEMEMKKWTGSSHTIVRLFCLSLLLFLIACTTTGCFLKQKESILGRWETENGEMMEITETDFIIQGLSFPYEMTSESQSGKQEFVIVVGSLGAVRGSCQLKHGILYMTIDGAEEQFHRR